MLCRLRLWQPRFTFLSNRLPQYCKHKIHPMYPWLWTLPNLASNDNTRLNGKVTKKSTIQDKMLLAYSAISFIIIILLSVQNLNLKKQVQQSEASPFIDYDTRPSIEISSSPSIGSMKAPITIVEFMDLECEACFQTAEWVDILMKKRPGKIRWVFKNFPLEYHHQAIPAASAALAAHVQGKFWEMRREILSLGLLEEPDFLGLARKLNLDITEFTQDMKPENWTNYIDRDLNEGFSLNIKKHPYLFYQRH